MQSADQSHAALAIGTDTATDTTAAATATPSSASTCVSVCGASGAVCRRWPRVVQSTDQSHAALAIRTDTDTASTATASAVRHRGV